jgi:hypothetical protein
MYTRSIFWLLVMLGLVGVPLVSHAAVVNFVPNPSFEEDEVILNDPAWTQWATWNDAAANGSTVTFDSTQSIDGNRSLRVNVVGGGTNWYFLVATMSIAPVKVGTRYTCTFWAKAQSPRPLTVQWKIGSDISWGWTDFQLTDKWTEYSLTAPSQGTDIKVEWLCGASTVPLWLDFVNVYEGEYVAGINPSGLRNPGAAGGPSPADEATDVVRDVVLGWTPGPWANTHNVYLGTSLADVNAASVANPLGVLKAQGHDASGLDVGRLELGQTYYWRVDEVNAPPSSAVIPGKVWSFTVEPYSYPLAGSLITASASSQNNADTGPEKTIDGSGLNAYDQHSTITDDMWLSSAGTPQWIQYEFDRTYKLDRMLVWNSNQVLEAALGFGAKDVSVQYSTDGESWTDLGNFVFNRAPGAKTCTANTAVDFQGIAAKYIKLTITSNWGGLLQQYGLAEVRFYYVPVSAREPDPAAGATGVSPQTELSWRAGRLAASHEVYLSTDSNAVADGTAPMVTTSQASYDVTSDLATTYYWKVNEVNAAETPAAWAGEVWSFSTAQYVVVDDFESYTNDSPNRVFQTWIDGAGFSADAFFPNGNPGNSTGSLVGKDPLLGDIMETTTVHGGAQSVPVVYENTTATGTSEITRTFAAAQDWTKFDVKTLTLYFYGDVDNTGSAPLWVKLTDKSNNSAKVTFEDATALTDQAWTEWNMPLDGFTGVDLTKIASMTIGIGPGVAAGQLFLDDIRLYPAREIPAPIEPVLVGHWTLDNNAQDSSGNGNNGTLGGGATYVAEGKIGAALSLDGVDDYVDCGNGASLNITDTITLSVWIKPNDVGNAEYNDYVGKSDHAYALKHNNTNVFEFVVYDGTWYGATIPVTSDQYNLNWHHLAGTYDGTQVKLYVDGKVVASRLRTGVIATTTYNVNIGRNSELTDRLYKGVIDDVRIYHGALPSSEIAKLANP